MKIEHWLLPNMQLNSEITDILLSISKNYQFNYIQLDFPTHKNSQKKKKESPKTNFSRNERNIKQGAIKRRTKSQQIKLKSKTIQASIQNVHQIKYLLLLFCFKLKTSSFKWRSHTSAFNLWADSAALALAFTNRHCNNRL